MRLCLLLAGLLAGLLAAGAAAPVAAPGQQVDQPPALFSAVPHPQQRCAAEVPLPPGLNLTEGERELLQYICWPPEGLREDPPDYGAAPPLRRGVPAGVNCTVTQW